jgi:hypothetical protein
MKTIICKIIEKNIPFIMAMKLLIQNYIIKHLAKEFGMSTSTTLQALCMLEKCWDLKMDRYKLAVICASLAFKFHEAEETSGVWIRPGVYHQFTNLASDELNVIKHLNYQMRFNLKDM